ncbi:alpha-mannosidase [Cohnella soli]|uniref:Alpha-mannosidase n=1 Tax=Cohnella soli TaxID=425005 RepID=A0ABW0HVN7_9BACL
MNRKKVFIAPTTHWDREWVMTKGQFQVRLVRLMDNLLKIMDDHPDYRFLLDGQAIVLEDYLAIRPEQRERLSLLMEEGRLVAGPWYVLADQFLENGESMIRNLLVGMETVRDMRGRPMMLGYVPDSFGSIASLPLILNGFRIPFATFGRGRPKWGADLAHYEFWWEGPAGSKVLAANHGYNHGVFLSYPDIWTDIMQQASLNPDPDETMARFLEEAGSQGCKAATSNLYFSVGIDHMEPRKSLPGLMAYINENQEKYELVYGTPEDYLNVVAEDARHLSVYAGEMRGSDELPMDLVGTLSSYMPLKQKNDRCEILLQREVEPLWAMASAASGASYPKGLLRHLWKLLLANHPHDSICGCSVDQVHKDMLNRYEEIEHTGAYLIKDGLHELISAIDTTGKDHDAVAVVVVNPLGRTHSGPVRSLVRVPRKFKYDAYTLIDDQGRTVPSVIRHIKDKNKDLESVYMTAEMLSVVISKDADDERPDDQVFTVLEVDFRATDVPEMGYRTYWIKPGVQAEAAPSTVTLCENGMENDTIKVGFHPDGTFELAYKRTGRIYRNLNFFVDREEIGDLYDHGEYVVSDERDSRSCEADWRLHEQQPDRIVFKADMMWELPEASGEDGRSIQSKKMRITMFATLHANTERLELIVDLDNVCEDHMLRAVFDTGLHAPTVAAFDHFHVVERKVRNVGEAWRDEPFQEFVDVSDSKEGLCLSTKGLPAYEAVNGSSGTRLYLTLLRSSGSVGQAAGANYPAPGGQCPGVHRFEYTLIPHEGNWLQGDCLGKASDYRSSFLVEADVQHEGKWPSTGSFLSVNPTQENNLYVSCLKQAEDGSGWVVRMWNPGEDGHVQVRSYLDIRDVRLAELDESLKDSVRSIEEGFPITAKEILTLKIVEA